MPSPPCKISSKSTNRFKSCAYHRNLNVRHFEMLKLRELIEWNKSRPQCHHLHIQFHQNSPHGSKVITVFLYSRLRSLNVHHCGMAEATRLKKLWRRGRLEWQYPPTKFHETLPIGSKVIGGKHTDRHTHTDRLVIWKAHFHLLKVG
jgi:hypothetical protein